MNRNFFVIIVLAIISIFAVPNVYAVLNWNSVIQPICQNNVCLEGTNAIWRMQLNNLGDEVMSVNKIELVDESGLVFGSRIFNSGELSINPKESKVFDMQGFVPPATKGSMVYYKVNYFVNGKGYSDTIKAIKIMPLSEVQCFSHEYCDSDEVCIGYRCIPESIVNTTGMNITRRDIKEESNFNFGDIMLIINALLLVLISYLLVKKKR